MKGRMRRKAFTLLELLIVVVIIGILAIVAVPQYLGAVQQAKNNTGLTDANSLANVAKAIASAGGDPTTGMTGSGTGAVTIDRTIDNIRYVARTNSATYTYAVTFVPATSTGTVTATHDAAKCSSCQDYTVNY